MEGDRPGDAGPEQPQDPAGQPVDPGAPATPPLGMGPPSDVPGGYGATTYGAGAYGDATTETVVEQRGWFSGARLTALVTAVVLVIAGTAVAVVLSGGDEGAQLEEVVPAGAVAFGRANLLPPGDQADAVRSIFERFPQGQAGSVGEAFERFLDEGLSQANLSFERDVKPWLGTQVGFVVTKLEIGDMGPQPRWALLAAVRNEAAARDALERVKQTQPGFAYQVREGTAFMSPDLLSLEGVLGAVDGKTGPLSGDVNFTGLRDRVPDDHLALVYGDGEQLQNAIPPGSPGLFPTLPGSAGRSIVVLRAEQDAMVLEGFSDGAGESAGAGVPALLEGAPAEMLGAVTLFDPAKVFEQGIELAGLFLFGFAQPFGGFDGDTGGFSGGFSESMTITPQQAQGPREMVDAMLRETFGLTLDRDVLPWMHGELSVVVGNISLQPEVGVLIESTDDDAAARTIDALRDNLEDADLGSGLEVSPTSGGFAVTMPDATFPIVVRRVAGKVVIASSDPYAATLLAASPQALADDAVYQRSVGEAGRDDVAFQMYLRLDRLAAILQVFMPQEEYSEAEAYLGQMEALGIRATTGDDGSAFRMVLTFK